MSEHKRYYWLKLKRDFFKQNDIQIIEAMPNGKDYLLFYLKMLLESIENNGELRFSDTIPYNEEMLSVITKTNVDVVRSAMKVFTQVKMIEVLDDETIYMSEVMKMMGSESTSAERVRKHRENLPKKQALLQSNAMVTKGNTEKEIEKEIEKEQDTEPEKESVYGAAAPMPTGLTKSTKKAKPGRNKYGEYGWVLLTQEQHACLLVDLGAEELSRCIKYIDESAQSNGNKNKWRDFNLVIRRCSKEGWGARTQAAKPVGHTSALDVLGRMLEETP